MSEKEKAPTREATRAEAVETVAFCEVSNSYDNFTTVQKERQPLRVSDLLGTGEENARTMKQIREIYHGDSRSIRQAIQKERLNGVAVLSGAHGYWLAGDVAEVERFCKYMGSRRREIGKVIGAVRASYGLTRAVKSQLDGQLTIDGGVGDG